MPANKGKNKSPCHETAHKRPGVDLTEKRKLANIVEY